MEAVCETESLEQLVEVSRKLQQALMVAISPENATLISQKLTIVAKTVSQHLLIMAEALLGKPPVSYAFIVSGSIAREELAGNSDQDNALVLSDEFCAEQHAEYFRQLAKYVSDGLAACGYSYCDGDVMATNNNYCQPLHIWQQNLCDWLAQPQLPALRKWTIFHDALGIYGKDSLWKSLHQRMIDGIQHQALAQVFMAGHALKVRPPRVLGENRRNIDLKKIGIGPIVEFARIYALDNGISARNTIQRLEQLKNMQKLDIRVLKELQEGFSFLTFLRLRKQAMQSKNGFTLDNDISLLDLSPKELRKLEHTFSLIVDCQEKLAADFTGGLLPPRG